MLQKKQNHFSSLKDSSENAIITIDNSLIVAYCVQIIIYRWSYQRLKR